VCVCAAVCVRISNLTPQSTQHRKHIGGHGSLAAAVAASELGLRLLVSSLPLQPPWAGGVHEDLHQLRHSGSLR